MRLRSQLAALALFAALAGPAAAQVPGRLTQQGRLLKPDGTPVTGSVPMTFAVYDVASGGNPLWTETRTVPLDNGYFVVTLGSQTPFPPIVWDGAARWIGIAVGTDAEMAPREEVTSTAYARRRARR